MIRRARKQSPGAVVAVCGCYPQTHPEDVKGLDVDLIAGTGDRMRFQLTHPSSTFSMARVRADRPPAGRTSKVRRRRASSRSITRRHHGPHRWFPRRDGGGVRRHAGVHSLLRLRGDAHITDPLCSFIFLHRGSAIYFPPLPEHSANSPCRTLFSTPMIRVGRVRLWRSAPGTFDGGR